MPLSLLTQYAPNCLSSDVPSGYFNLFTNPRLYSSLSIILMPFQSLAQGHQIAIAEECAIARYYRIKSLHTIENYTEWNKLA